MNRPLLVALEGSNDFQFLERLSNRLRIQLPDTPNFAHLQATGQIVTIPVGGGNPSTWPNRFRPLGLREFHLYDREQLPETDDRIRAVELINYRPGCRALLTRKRALENYLSPTAIALAGGGDLRIGDEDSVSMLLARHWFEQARSSSSWNTLCRRSQRRLSARAKRRLNEIAVAHMSADLLTESDPHGEVLGWFSAIQEMLASTQHASVA